MYKKNGERRLDVDRKIIGVVTFGLLCAILLIAMVNISINTASGVRAFVAGEGYWAKAQKEAGMHLSNYIITEDPEEYDHFRSVLRVIEGDRAAREELQKEDYDYDYDVVYEGFITGFNHPDDIQDMVNLLRRFQGISHVKQALEIWTAGDEKVDEFKAFAASIDAEIRSSNSISNAQKTQWMEELEVLDHELTELEYNFSLAMGNMARLVNEIFRWSTITLGLILIFIGIWITSRFYRSTQTWTKALKESEQQLKNVLDNSKDVIYKLDLNTRKYVFVSPAIESMLGYKQDNFTNGGVSFILSIMHPNDRERMSEIIQKYDHLEDGDFLPTTEFRLQDTNGNWKWVSNVRSLIQDKQGEPQAIVGSVRDISTQKEQEEKIKESLNEKELLLKEIHHRVKNNLAIISSLLELQKDGVSEDIQQMLSSSQARIKSIAKVHQKLYESTTLSDIPLDVYITELIDEIEKAYTSKEKEIDIIIDVAPLKVNINDAIPIGLILNELINNAFKHAYKGLQSGVLKVILHKGSDEINLFVESDGNKMDSDYDSTQSDSLGMTLIEVLVKRINGRLEIEQDDWTRFKIFFELNENGTA